MAELTTAKTTGRVAPRDLSRLVEDALDEMAVTDREYHHLNLTVPLVAEIAAAVQRGAGAGVGALLIGGSSLLAEALVLLELDLEIWTFDKALLPESLWGRVSREVSVETLVSERAEGRYGLVIVPLVLESLAGDASPFLARLRRRLAPNGRLILVARNQSRLENRWAAAVGKRFSLRTTAPVLSMSWPALTVLHEYHQDELIELSRQAGFRVMSSRFVNGSRVFLELTPMPIETYAAGKLGRALRSVVPTTRDTILLELAPRPGDEVSRGAPTRVTVCVAPVHGGERLRQTLTALDDQTYPRDLYEVLVAGEGGGTSVAGPGANGASMHRGGGEPVAFGPTAANRALAAASGDLVAFVDDGSILPGDWIEAGVALFDEDTGVVSGPVFIGPDSHPRYLDVPGSRADPGEREGARADLFPACDVIYRKDVALAAGGFSLALETDAGAGALGWDTELAWRLQRLGWQARFREELTIARVFPAPGGGRFGGHFVRASQLPDMYRRAPEVRRALFAGVFASRHSMYFDMMFGGAILTALRRNPRWLLLSWPWLGLASRRFGVWPPGGWPQSAKVVAKMAVLNLVWLAGMVKGSIKAKRLVL